MKVTIDLWIIALIECTTGPVNPLYFYDKESDTWSKEQKVGMTFSSKEEAEETFSGLGVDAEILKINAIINTELGITKDN